MNDLRVLTVRQPWAAAIAADVKRVENRTRPTSYRGSVAIHAGLATDVEAWQHPPEHLRAYLAGRPETERASEMPHGVILAVTYLVSCHRAGGPECGCLPAVSTWSDFGDGIYHWCLAATRRLETPIPYRGALGLPRALPDLMEQLSGGSSAGR